jgi:diguanylate cyclase (GGDEF)-like protein
MRWDWDMTDMLQAASRPDYPPRLILIANDQEWAARSLETILAPRGYAVLRAYNARQMLELTRRAQPDIAIIDARLPDANGIELCAMLRETGQLSPSAPILITTSDPETRGQEMAAYRAGAWDFLLFPIDADVLLLKLESFMRAKQETDWLHREGLLDHATGLYNARGLARRAREIGADVFRRHAALACVVFSPEPALDDDSMDALVEHVARHLGTVMGRIGRAADAIGRLGQSEFAIIAPGTPPGGALRLAERIRTLLEEAPFEIPATAEAGEVARTQHVRLRAGYYAVTDFAESSVDAVEMLVRAASALRQSPSDDANRPAIREFATPQAASGK